MAKSKKVAKKSESLADIKKLVRAGTKEAVAKLRTLMEKETDQERKEDLQLDVEEAEAIYYEPANEQEEKDFNLAKLVNNKEKIWLAQDDERNALLCRVNFARLELAIRQKMLKEAVGEAKDMAQVNVDVTEDVLTMEESRLAEIEESLDDTEAFMKAAKQMIKTKKYQDLPEAFFEDYYFDDEDLDDLSEDEDGCCCCGCHCECGESDCEDVVSENDCECGGCECNGQCS